jgi:hypothetical protein
LTTKSNTFPFELLFFTAALIGLYFLDSSAVHISFCPLAAMGLDFCPGCGLGRSIHSLMHGHFKTSLEMHPLGFFAFGVIILRIYTLTRKRFNYFPKIRGHE